MHVGVVTEWGAGSPPRVPDLELPVGLLLPGLVDLQVNGYFGVELQTAGGDGWARVATSLPETGTTAFLPTFITAPPGALAAALRAAAVIVPALRRRADRGLGGEALTDLRLTGGRITDMRHVAARVCVMAFTAAPGRICAVTDAAACAGMPPGRYVLGGEPIELPPGDGEPPVRADGTLAGSALRMDVALANMVAAGIGLADAVAAASRIPADLIGRPALGRIAPRAAT